MSSAENSSNDREARAANREAKKQALSEQVDIRSIFEEPTSAPTTTSDAASGSTAAAAAQATTTSGSDETTSALVSSTTSEATERDNAEEREEHTVDEAPAIRPSMAEAIAKLCERFQYGNDEPTLGIRWAFWHATLKKEKESDTLDDVIKMLTDRFVCKGSEMAQRVRFGFEGKRRDGESVDQFVIRLRDLAKYCGFKDLEENVIYQLIIGCGIDQLRRKISCGETEHVTLTDAIEMAKGYEREAIDASLLAKAAREPGAAIHHLSTT